MKKILVVEDELMMRDLVIRKLSSKNYEVKIAADGREAYNLWIKERPDLVLLDLILPEMNGFDVLRRIREDKDAWIANTPVIVLSNLWTNEDILRAQNLKIQGYIIKAYFTTDDILKKVDELFQKMEKAQK